MTVKEVFSQLESLSNEKMLALHRKNGAKPDKQFGVKLGDIRSLAKKIKVNHELAMELWETGNVSAGAFLNNKEVYFADYKHFGGNRTIFANMGVTSNYRFMDYYQYSTQSQYISTIVHYQFRKFLLTQLPMLRFSGVRENIFFNYLKTQNSPHYWEVGYSLDNLFRIFRLEMGAGFENGKYSRGGVRFGIASFINIGFDE